MTPRLKGDESIKLRPEFNLRSIQKKSKKMYCVVFGFGSNKEGRLGKNTGKVNKPVKLDHNGEVVFVNAIGKKCTIDTAGHVSINGHKEPRIPPRAKFATSSAGSNASSGDAPAGGEPDPQWQSNWGRGRGNQGGVGYEGRIIINYGPPSNVTENTQSYGYSGGDHALTLP